MRSKTVGKVVLTLAAISWIVALIVLTPNLLPVGNGSLEHRTSMSQAISAIFGLSLGIIAIVFTVLVSSADYRAEQQFKTDLISLLAAMRSVQSKCGLTMGTDMEFKSDDFATERRLISEFLTSTSGYALRCWIERRTRGIPEGVGSEWRVFFMMLSELSHEPRSWKSAVKIENLLTSLKREDLKQLTEIVSDLFGSIDDFERSRNADTLIAAMTSIAQAEDPSQWQQQQQLARLRQLRAQGVNDPDVDLWVSLLSGDSDAQRAALAAGANKGVTVETILDRYRSRM